MPFTPLAFTGISTYSDDLNTVLQRAVSIASLPLKSLQNQDSDILSKKTALASLTTAIGALGASVSALGTVAARKGLVAASSDSFKVAVSYAGATTAATYAITDITSVAQAASETSLSGYADTSSAPVSSTGDVKLVFGSLHPTIHLTPATNNLAGLRDAINNLGIGVNATLLTTGTGATPNYLSVTSNTFGATTLHLVDDPDGAATNLLTNANQGSNAIFKVNGVNVSKSSNVINDVISGATFTILDKTDAGESVTLSLQSNRSQLQSAIQDFANRYNSLVDAVGAHVGQNAGSLSGDFLVRETQSDLRLLTSYSGTGAIQNLSDLGVELGSDGKMTFDTTAFGSLSDDQVSSAFTFFGSETTGFAALTKKFTQISDPVTGLARLQQDNYDQTDKRLQNEIENLNDRISNLQSSLTAKLQAADALLAQLNSQQKVLTASIEALNTVSYGKRNDN